MALINEMYVLATMVKDDRTLAEMAAAVGWTEKYVEWVIGTDGFKLLVDAAPSSPGSEG